MQKIVNLQKMTLAVFSHREGHILYRQEDINAMCNVSH